MLVHADKPTRIIAYKRIFGTMKCGQTSQLFKVVQTYNYKHAREIEVYINLEYDLLEFGLKIVTTPYTDGHTHTHTNFPQIPFSLPIISKPAI